MQTRRPKSPPLSRRAFAGGGVALIAGGVATAVAAPPDPLPPDLAASIELPNVAALRRNAKPYPVVRLAGHETAGDGGEGVFRLDPDDKASADDGGTLIVDAAKHRYRRTPADATASVKWWGAKGDGKADDRAAIQAAIDYLLALPPSTPKRLLFPNPARFYRIGSLLSVKSRYPDNHWWGTTARYAFFLPNAKNLTLAGEGDGRVRLVMDPSFSKPDDCMFGIASELNKPGISYDARQPYFPSLMATESRVEPVTVGENWVRLAKGKIADFPVGDLAYFYGAGNLAQYGKITAVDAALGRIYFERPFNLKFGWMNFSTVREASAGARKIYVESFIWFSRYQALRDQLTITLTLDDASTLTTTVTEYGFDGAIDAGSFITIKDAIPAGRAMPAGSDIALNGHSSGLGTIISDTSYKRQLTLLRNADGTLLYPFVSAADTLWCVTPENLTFRNLSMEGGYYQLHASGMYNLAIDNCRLTTTTGECLSLGCVCGFTVTDSDIEELSGGYAGLQLSPASTKNIRFARSNFIGTGAGFGECGEDIQVDQCTFTANRYFNPARQSFFGVGQCRDVSIRRSKVLALGGWLATKDATGQLMSLGGGDNPFATDSLLLEECEFVFQPGTDATGTEKSNQYLATGAYLRSVIMRNNRFSMRGTSAFVSFQFDNFTFEGNEVRQVDAAYRSQIGGGTKATATNGVKRIVGNRMHLSSQKAAPSPSPCWQLNWLPHGDVGYVNAVFESNLYDGFACVFAIGEDAPAGQVLSNIVIRDERVTNPQHGFAWNYQGNPDFFPLSGIDADGLRTWKASTTDPRGGIVKRGEKIVYATDGAVAKVRTCVVAGAIGAGAYSDTVDYPANRWVTAADRGIYRALRRNGPRTSVADPLSSPEVWQPMSPAVAIFRTEMWANTVPAAGNFVRGDVVWNTLPAAGGNLGWICIADGAPGTWKAFGAIDQ